MKTRPPLGLKATDVVWLGVHHLQRAQQYVGSVSV